MNLARDRQQSATDYLTIKHSRTLEGSGEGWPVIERNLAVGDLAHETQPEQLTR